MLVTLISLMGPFKKSNQHKCKMAAIMILIDNEKETVHQMSTFLHPLSCKELFKATKFQVFHNTELYEDVPFRMSVLLHEQYIFTVLKMVLAVTWFYNSNFSRKTSEKQGIWVQVFQSIFKKTI